MIYNTKELRSNLVKSLSDDVSSMTRKPVLKVLLVGDNPASVSYVTSKQRLAEQIGIDAETIKITENISQKDLNDYIEIISNQDNVDGVLLQLPLPSHLDENEALSHLNPQKDVDGLTLIQQGKLFSSTAEYKPCTPKGIMTILSDLGYHDLAGLNVVVVGRSKLVGMPVAKLCQDKNATVTICHSKTKSIKNITRNADILIVAIGRANTIDSSYISDNVKVVIDVGINRINGKLYGDCDTLDIEEKHGDTCTITSVPGGVGPMTVVSLIENTIQSARGLKTCTH